MHPTEAASLALRVAAHTADGVLPRPSLAPVSDPDEGLCLALLPLPGRDNPWEADAILAVAAQPDDERGILAGSLVLQALQTCLREPAPGDGELPALLPCLVRTAAGRASRAQRPEETVPALVFVKANRYYILSSGHTQAYLLRHGVVHSLAHGVPGEDPKPDWRSGGNGSSLHDMFPLKDHSPPALHHAAEVVSGWLEDGDALILCTEAVSETISDHDMGQAALIAHSPNTVAIRLAEEARQRSGRNASVAVLFAGVGPALASRLRAGWRNYSYPEPALMPSPEPVVQKAASPPVSLIAALAALTGILLGGAGGIWLALTLIQPSGPPSPPPAVHSPSTMPVRAEVPTSSSSPGLQAGTPGSSRPGTPAGAPNGPPPRGNRPPGPALTPGTPVQPAFARVGDTRPSPAEGTRGASPQVADVTPSLQPAAAGTPPVHAVAPGMSARARLTVALNAARGELVLTASQGVLTSPAAPLGIPARQPLVVPVGAAVQERLRDGLGELRLLNAGGQLIFTLRKESIQWLLQGGAVVIPELAPGDYRVACWHPQQQFPEPPFLALNISNL
jgi:hypothetical protein